MSINDKALLVKMSISQWYNRVNDKKVAEEVAIQHGVNSNLQNKYVKQIMSNVALVNVHAIISALRAYHNDKTLPWKENGVRILPAASFMDYQKQIAALRNSFDSEVKIFLAKYPDWVAESRRTMGSLFCEDDYPEVSTLKDKFSLEVSCMPFPNEADFRIDVDNAAMEELRAQTAADIRTALDSAVNSIRLRILERIRMLYNALEDNRKVIREDTFYAVITAAADAGTLNLTNDADLRLLISRVDFLNSVTVKTLRTNGLQRWTVANRLHEILLGYPS